MGRGRAPCCDKSQVKRGPWSPAEDLRLITFIQKNGHDNWRALPKQAGLARCGKSCRLRWINYLRPDLRRGNFTPEEEDAILKLHNVLGNKWSKIASHLPGRTDNEIKNVWNTHLKKRLSKKVIGAQSEPKESSMISSASSSVESCKHHKSAIVYQEVNNMVVPISNHQTSPNNEETMKVMRSISSSSTSHSSLVSITDELDVTMRDELMDSSFDYSQSNNKNNNQASNMEDASHETTLHNGFELVPLELDFDIWELLDDNLGSLQSSNLDQQQGPVGEVIQSSGHDKNLVQDEEVDSINWLKYIECELELDASSADDDGKRIDGLKTKNGRGNDLAEPTLKQDVDCSSSEGLNSFQQMPADVVYLLRKIKDSETSKKT